MLMIRRISIPAVFLLALYVFMPCLIHAQSSTLDLLTGGSSKSWRSVSIEDNGNPVQSTHTIILDVNGTVTAHDHGETITGRWALIDDRTMIMFDNRSGEWSSDDTMTVTIDELTTDRLAVASVVNHERARIHYVAEAGDSVKKAADFTEFWERFKAAVKKNDKKKVASMTNFPFRSYDLMGIIKDLDHGPSFTREEFLRHFNKLFDKRARQLIAVSTPTPFTDDDGGITRYAVGISGGKTSTTWIEFWLDDNGKWWLVGTDNVSYGDEEEE